MRNRSAFPKEWMNKMDNFFFEAKQLDKEVQNIREEKKTAAFESSDPTAREAVEGIAEIPAAMTYNRPEAWLRVADMIWTRFNKNTDIGRVMYRRYVLKESWQRTCTECYIDDATYFAYRRTFIESALLAAYALGIIDVATIFQNGTEVNKK